mmetsp:Transcript_33327/g.108992  ORF Transcript_33327/g.108992 Transcript_33327/m.108992 type:complete len:825 (-) Transcript_33327:434-2908(-)
MLLAQQVVAQRGRVVRRGARGGRAAVKGRDGGEDVKRALRHRAAHAGHASQPADHVVALAPEVCGGGLRKGAVRVRDGGDARVLCDRGGAGRVVALHLCHRLDGALRAADVAEPEARHRRPLGEAVDGEGALVHPFQRREGHVRLVVRYELVDLVGEDNDLRVAPQHRRDALEGGAREQSAGRVGWVAKDEHPRLRRDGRLESGGLQHVLLLGARLEQHGRRATELRDAEVRRPVRRRHDDLVAWVAQREHSLQDRLLRAAAADHLRRLVLEALPAEQIVAHGGAQLVRPRQRGVLDLALAQRLVRRLHHLGRRRKVGLADREGDDGLALPLELDGEIRDGDRRRRGHRRDGARDCNLTGRRRRRRAEVEYLAPELGEGGAELVHHVVRVCVVRVERVEEVERVAARVVDELEQRLEALRRDRRRLQLQLGEESAGEVRHELRRGGERVVSLARQLDHLAAFVFEEGERARGSVVVCDAHLVVDARQPLPAVPPRVGPEHGVGAQHVGGRGQHGEHCLLGVRLDGEDVYHERLFEQRRGQRAQHLLEGEDRGCDEEHVHAQLGQRRRVWHPRDPHARRRLRVVAARVSEDSVAAPDPAAGEELAEGSEADDADAEPRGGPVRHARAGGGGRRGVGLRRSVGGAQHEPVLRVAAEHRDARAHLAQVAERVLRPLLLDANQQVDVKGVLEASRRHNRGPVGRGRSARLCAARSASGWACSRAEHARLVWPALDLGEVDVSHREDGHRLEEDARLVAVRCEDDGRLGGEAEKRARRRRGAREDEEAREVVRVVLDPVVQHLEAVHLGRVDGSDRGGVAQPLLHHQLC